MNHFAIYSYLHLRGEKIYAIKEYQRESFVLLAGVGLRSGPLLAASHSFLRLGLLLYVVFGVFTACLGVEEVDLDLIPILIELLVGEEVVDISLVILDVVSSSGYRDAVLMFEGIVFAVVVEGALGYSVVFGGVDGLRGSL